MGRESSLSMTVGWLLASWPFLFLLVNEGLRGQRPSRLLAQTAQRCSHLRLALCKPSVITWAKIEVRTWAEGISKPNQTLVQYCEMFKMIEVAPEEQRTRMMIKDETQPT